MAVSFNTESSTTERLISYLFFLLFLLVMLSLHVGKDVTNMTNEEEMVEMYLIAVSEVTISCDDIVKCSEYFRKTNKAGGKCDRMAVHS